MTSADEPDRARTGNAGLDQILGGGLPHDRTYLHAPFEAPSVEE